ncbi:MAG: carbon storage regulator CsrA [Myxococcales bacterium]|nr:carbon storage regulator CsrA [Myxococcales bacterium]
MLVLSRKSGEALRVGEDIRITVVSTASGQVRIGIEAPDEVTIYREEVYERIVQANVEAAKTSSEASHAVLPPKVQKGIRSRESSE